MSIWRCFPSTSKKLLLTVTAMGLVAASLVFSIDIREAQAFLPSEKMAFVTYRDGDWEIFTMYTNGSSQTNITNNTFFDQYPDWSPDASQLAFSTNRDGDMEVYVMNADGSGATNLSNSPEYDYQPDWSPDGSRIVFSRMLQGSNFEIYVMNADGSGQTRLTDSAGVDFTPSWSPDGRSIAFASDRDGERDIYVMNADGSGTPVNLTNSDWDERSPEWSPDGSKIAYSGYVVPPGADPPSLQSAAPGFIQQGYDPGIDQIMVMDSDGTGKQNLSNSTDWDYEPVWSPDGSRIAFTRYFEATDMEEVFIMNANGSGQTNITNFAGENEMPAWQGKGPKNYYWSWYDNVGGDNWILFSNPRTGQLIPYSLSIAGDQMDLSAYGNGVVGPRQSIAPQFDLRGGAVKARAGNGVDGILSQRTLWPKGGNSLEEVPAIRESSLSNHYWWTWYDSVTPGYRNWILVSNPSATTAVDYQIRIAGDVVESSELPPLGSVTREFPDGMGGPVELTAEGAVIASQRVLSNGGMAFNELPGIPDNYLRSGYIWTWYDSTAPGSRDWILVANPAADGGATVHFTISVAGVPRAEGDLAPGESAAPEFAGVMGGPVEVVADGRIIATQRIIWGPSFGEVPGSHADPLPTSHNWTWYDQSAAGIKNWILVANPSPGNTVNYEIRIGGVLRDSGALAPGARVTPEFAGLMGGPVEVTSTGGGVIASQRVIWNGYFNEVLGTTLQTP